MKNTFFKEDCMIIENNKLAHNIWTMSMSAPKITNQYLGAGQFILLQTSQSLEHPLRRPMSIAGVNGDELSIIYKTVGSVTNYMTGQKPGETMNVIGPVGNVFSEWEGVTPILIGGGIGLAPILNFRKQLSKSITIIGARTANEHFFDHSPKNGIYITTDDGTQGINGTVIDALNHIIDSIERPKIFACGPTPMFKALQSFSVLNNVPAQFSVESYMACGIGICQGCVIRKSTKENQKDPSYHKHFDLVCKNGPVFQAEDISFD